MSEPELETDLKVGSGVQLQSDHTQTRKQLEEVARALEDSEARYRLLAENASDIVWQTNVDGLVEWVSPSLASVLGWSTESIVGTDAIGLVHPDDLQVLSAWRDAFPEVAPTAAFEIRMRTSDNGYRWMSNHAQLTTDPDGSVTGRIVGSRDIGAEVAAREKLERTALALEDSEARYRLLAENASDIVWQLDSDGAIQWVSPSVKSVVGWSPDQLLGTDPSELTHPVDRASLAVWRGDLFAGAVVPEFELRIRTADSSYRWMAVQRRATSDDAGSETGTIVSLRDIDLQVKAREQVDRSERMFRMAMDGAPQGMAIVRLDRRFLQVNHALCTMLGRDEQWLLEHTIADVTHPEDLEADLAGRDGLIRGDSQAIVAESRWLRSDGSELWITHSTGLLRDEQQMPLFYVSHVQDNSEAHRLGIELAHRASHDSLTGLMNRDDLQERITAALHRMPEFGGLSAVLYCDLDNFKLINDKHGHSVGDDVLKVTAERIAASLRHGDIVTRMGGDEFVVVLTEVTDVVDAVTVAQKIRDAVKEPLLIGSQFINVATSIGVAFDGQDTDANRLLRDADVALYAAKHSGRDQVAIFRNGHASLIRPAVSMDSTPQSLAEIPAP
ncbi:MAG: PAS domain S-box protein [Actinomycetes bacterium]